MQRRLVPILASLAATLVALGAAEARAAEPRWTFERRERARYIVDAVPFKAGANKATINLPGAVLVGPEDFIKGRTYKARDRRLEDLVLRCLLSIPNGRKRKGAYTLGGPERLTTPAALELSTAGRAKMKTSGRKAKISGLLLLRPGAKPSPSYSLKEGQITWSSVFDTKIGAIVEASYDLKMVYNMTIGGKVTGRTILARGRLRLASKAKPDPEQSRKAIAKAIAGGSTWLRDHVQGMPNKKDMGRLSIAAFALLRSGVPVKDPAVVTAFQALSQLPLTRTYDVSLYIMALEARSVKRLPPSRTSSTPRFERQQVPRNDLGTIQKLADWLVKARNPGKGNWGYTPPGEGGEGQPGRFDNSNTQFAVLALHAAHRAGARVPIELWEEVFRHFEDARAPSSGKGGHEVLRSGQRPKAGKKNRPGTTERGGAGSGESPGERGWNYTRAGQAYGSMTNAGLSSIAIAAEMLRVGDKLSADKEKAFRAMAAEGLQWDAAHFSVTQNPGRQGEAWYFYYMYSLEKACELLDVASFNGRDWYAEGAEQLCALQDPNGSWRNTGHQTALALLFLNRATLKTTVEVLGRREKTGAGPSDRSDRDKVFIEDAEGVVSLSELLAALEGAGRSEQRKHRGWFEDGIETLAATDRPIVIPGLLPLLESRRLDSWARKQLRRIVQDSRMKEAADFRTWHERWALLDSAGREHAFDRIPLLREVLKDEDSRLLRRLAGLAAVRLMAVELVPDLAPLLDRPGERKIAEDCLLVLMGRAPKDRADAEAWARDELTAALAAPASRRRIARAARGEKTQRRALIAAGKASIPGLLRRVDDPFIGAGVRDILTAITGQRMAAKDWPGWWEKNKKKLDASGKLPKKKRPRKKARAGKGR